MSYEQASACREKSREAYESKEIQNAAITPEMAAIATSEVYTEPVLVANWELPAGAYGESDGPT